MSWLEDMRFELIAELTLHAHRNCAAGSGDTMDDCALKTALLKIHADAGMTFPISQPDPPSNQRKET